MKKMLFAVTILASIAFATDKADYNLMQNKIDVIHYTINLKISDLSFNISAKTEINFRTVSNLEELKFNLREMNVHSCALDSKPIDFKHEDGILQILLSEIIEKNTNHTITVNYNGAPKSGL